MIEKANSKHVTVELWAIDSVNANAWKSAKKCLSAIAADLCLIQETKVPAGPSKDVAAQAARIAKWNASLLPLHRLRLRWPLRGGGCRVQEPHRAA